MKLLRICETKWNKVNMRTSHTGVGAWDGGGLPCRAARRSSISSEEGTGFTGPLSAASRASISFSDGIDSMEDVHGQTGSQRLSIRHYRRCAVLPPLGLVSSFSFSSLSISAWSSLLKPLVGMCPAMVFLLCPGLAGWWSCCACFASSAATRLEKQ